jgi:hypothetical protein
MCSVSVGCTYNTSMQILYGAEWKTIVRLSHCSIIERGIDSLGSNKNIVHCKISTIFWMEDIMYDNFKVTIKLF